jgi:uncharacterized protein (DUF849 family)
MFFRPHLDPSRSCIVSCALSGVVANRAQCPAIPYTPEEYASEAKRAYDAGAVAVHIHARSPDGQPSFAVADYQNIRDAIVAECPVIINFSTGALGVSVEERVAYLRAGRPAVAALNMGSMNYAKYNAAKKKFVFDFVFPNPHAEILQFVQAMRDEQIRPEMECFDLGHVGSARVLADMGIVERPYVMSLVMGVVGGIPATTENLVHMANQLPDGAEWQVVGISRDQWRLCAAACSMGGNVRVGLEDNFYLRDGVMAASNGELVEKVVRMVQDQGRTVADVTEARARLGTVWT